MSTKLAAVSLAASLALITIPSLAQEPPPALPADDPPDTTELAAPAAAAPAAAVPLLAAPDTFAHPELESATVVSEPGTWALLGLGIVGLGLARRRLAALGRGGN